MPRSGRPKAVLELTDQERDQLQRWARRRKSSQALALRSRIVLACASGSDNKTVAAELGCAQATVGKWRARFVQHRLDGLSDEDRPGRPASITAEQVEDVVVATLESVPANATHWSRAKMAERSGLSRSTIGRIWKTFELKPHRADGFKLSNDPLFVEKVYDVVGLYLNPPEAAVVLSVDEKSQVQALARSQPAFPMMPGMPEKRTHDYVRHGTTSLFAAFNVADGSVISSLHRRHRSTEFKKFLVKIDTEVPDDLEIHLICDNYGTHKHPTVRKWLEAHPRFHMHFTPTYSSWINQVERFFAFITADLLGPQRPPVRASTRERHPRLGESLERQPQALHLDQIGRRDPGLTRATSSTNYRRRTLGVDRIATFDRRHVSVVRPLTSRPSSCYRPDGVHKGWTKPSARPDAESLDPGSASR